MPVLPLSSTRFNEVVATDVAFLTEHGVMGYTLVIALRCCATSAVPQRPGGDGELASCWMRDAGGLRVRGADGGELHCCVHIAGPFKCTDFTTASAQQELKLKRRMAQRNGYTLVAVPPQEYGPRFCDFLKTAVIQQ